MSYKPRGPKDSASYNSKPGRNHYNNREDAAVVYVPKSDKSSNSNKSEQKQGINSKMHGQDNGPIKFEEFISQNKFAFNNSEFHKKGNPPKYYEKRDTNPRGGNNTVLASLTTEDSLKSVLGVKDSAEIAPKTIDETSLKSVLGVMGQGTKVIEKIETKYTAPNEVIQPSTSILFTNTLNNNDSKQLESFLHNSLKIPPSELYEEVTDDKIEEFIEESLKEMTKHEFNSTNSPLEEEKDEKIVIKPQSNKINMGICQQFYDVYYQKKIFRRLFEDVKKCWEAGEATIEDRAQTYTWLLNCNFSSIKSDNIFFSLLFHLMIEKEYYELALTIFQRNKNILSCEQTFGPIITSAVNFLEKRGYKSQSNQNFKLKADFSNRIEIADLGVLPNNIHLIDRFERAGKKLRVPAFDKIASAEKIAIHYEMNPFYRDYISVITIATKDEIVIIDLERLCKYEEILVLIIEFFEVILSKRATVIIMFDSRDLIEKLIHSLAIENEHKLKEIMQAKIKLCQAVQRHRSHFTDFSLLGYESVRDMANKLFNQDIDQRERFGSWYRRPLADSQLMLATIHVRLLYLSYDKLFAKDL